MPLSAVTTRCCVAHGEGEKNCQLPAFARRVAASSCLPVPGPASWSLLLHVARRGIRLAGERTPPSAVTTGCCVPHGEGEQNCQLPAFAKGVAASSCLPVPGPQQAGACCYTMRRPPHSPSRNSVNPRLPEFSQKLFFQPVR
jgi:hypothetical protein